MYRQRCGGSSPFDGTKFSTRQSKWNEVTRPIDDPSRLNFVWIGHQSRSDFRLFSVMYRQFQDNFWEIPCALERTHAAMVLASS
jgi:hypothetical protein